MSNFTIGKTDDRPFHWLRWIACVFGLLLFVFMLAWPKIWQASPPDFLPVIKISLLDRFSAWKWKQAALKAEQVGNHEQAMLSWIAALGKNSADPTLLRGFFSSLLHEDASNPHRVLVVGKADWLLRLTHTNQSDFEIIVQVYEKCRFYETLGKILEPKAQSLSRPLESSYLKVLFNTGEMTLYSQRWARVSGQFSNDQELALYQSAYQAGWGLSGAATNAQHKLEMAQKDPKWGLLAHQLQIVLSMKLNDEKGYERSFQALIEKRADIPSDHVNYWRLLKSIGQKDKAIELAKIYSSLPNSSEEIVRLANAYTELELRELAGKLFKRYAGQFVDSDELWLAHANLLMEGQSWTELLDLAGQIRREKYAREKLEAYSYYMEGRARLGLKQPALAEAAFHKIPEYVFHNTTQGLITGANLLQLGFPDPSVRILLKLQNSMEDNYIYWQLVKSCAEQLKQTNQMLSAAAKIKRLQEKSASGAQEMR